ncbi:hypothetical protein FQN57_006951 [Myotisia sp. PD_48]|nr:hypothetical protein FQN57_006951 [Myotisia sp. PD_48]
MEDPDLIATLVATDGTNHTESAFRLSHNRTRYLPPADSVAEGPTISSRECTPAPEPDTPLSSQESSYHDYEVDDFCNTHRIRLTFSNGPKNPMKGFVFGTDPNTCDVLLGYRGAKGISAQHFCITFDESEHLVLKDLSTWGSTVSYSDQAKDQVRRKFVWILDLKNQKKDWSIEVFVPTMKTGLSFKIILARHNNCQAEYQERKSEFIQHARSALPPVDLLGIQSTFTSFQPSQAFTPKQDPVYISERKLGGGSFGNVDKVVNVSTGLSYARKQFHEPPWNSDRNVRKSQADNWLNLIYREMRIMRDHPHIHTVEIIDFQESPSPFLVMPYYSLGNLEVVHRTHPLSAEEVVELLYQSLEALAYLHPRGVVHRDLKPENILVETRSPFNIKLADFGLANDGSDLRTFCGTRKYAAPEIYFSDKYTSAVDIWSLGVLILRYICGLPGENTIKREKHRNPRSSQKGWARGWCQTIIECVNRFQGHDVIDLLADGMLRMVPKERFAASDCLEAGYEIGIFQNRSIIPGSETPTQESFARGQSPDEKDDSIIMNALWNMDDSVDMRPQKDANSHRNSQYDGFGLVTDLEIPNDAIQPSLSSFKRRRLPTTRSPARDSDNARIKRRQRSDSSTTVSEGEPDQKKDQFLLKQTHLSLEADPDLVLQYDSVGSLSEITQHIHSDAQLVAEHCRQGCYFQTDEYFQLVFDSRYVMIRKTDCRINATQVLGVAGIPRNVLKTLKHENPPTVVKGSAKCQGTYVDFKCGLSICGTYGLHDLRSQLLNFAVAYRQYRENHGLPVDALPIIKIANRQSGSSRTEPRSISTVIIPREPQSQASAIHCSPQPLQPGIGVSSQSHPDEIGIPPEPRSPVSIDVPEYNELEPQSLQSWLRPEPSYAQGSFPALVKNSSYLQVVHPALKPEPISSLNYDLQADIPEDWPPCYEPSGLPFS